MCFFSSMCIPCRWFNVLTKMYDILYEMVSWWFETNVYKFVCKKAVNMWLTVIRCQWHLISWAYSEVLSYYRRLHRNTSYGFCEWLCLAKVQVCTLAYVVILFTWNTNIKWTERFQDVWRFLTVVTNFLCRYSTSVVQWVTCINFHLVAFHRFRSVLHHPGLQTFHSNQNIQVS